MADRNTFLIIMLVVCIVLLLISMILSSMASSSAKKNLHKDTNAHKYSKYAAIVSGVSVLLISISLIMYYVSTGNDPKVRFHKPVTIREGPIRRAPAPVYEAPPPPSCTERYERYKVTNCNGNVTKTLVDDCDTISQTVNMAPSQPVRQQSNKLSKRNRNPFINQGREMPDTTMNPAYNPRQANTLFGPGDLPDVPGI